MVRLSSDSHKKNRAMDNGVKTVGTAGTVIAVRGSVVDLRFAPETLPALDEGIEILWDRPTRLVAEVQLHLDNRTVRAIALQDTAGLKRGTAAQRTGQSLAVPV